MTDQPQFVKRINLKEGEGLRTEEEELEKKTAKHDAKIQEIFEAIKELMKPPPVKPKRLIGFHS